MGSQIGRAALFKLKLCCLFGLLIAHTSRDHSFAVFPRPDANVWYCTRAIAIDVRHPPADAIKLSRRSKQPLANQSSPSLQIEVTHTAQSRKKKKRRRSELAHTPKPGNQVKLRNARLPKKMNSSVVFFARSKVSMGYH